ncbi:hypothetical protein C8R46DRAFT_277214 [Mycena filopes]|nr:hypothetical protein C8R46DRAFT_277214 [Mycena filopes]
MLGEPESESCVDSVADREARAADRTLLADIDTKIADLEHALAQLRTAKKSAQARLDAVTYPVLTLPVEIVSEIFTQFLPAYPLCPPLTGLSSPTLVTHICHLWREIALNTPTLWRAVDLDLDDSEIVIDTQLHMANIWLGRSRSRSLSIQIRSETQDLDVVPIIKSFSPHIARCEHLSIALAQLSVDLPLLGPMPLLRSLLATVELSLPTSAFSCPDAPLLHSATLNDVTSERIILPWAQLTSLTLHSVFPRECTPVLRQTPHLIYCSLSLLRDAGVPTPQMSLPYLESLEMLEMDAEPVAGYLETFIVPALSTLRVPESFLGVDPIGGLRSFIGRSDCKVRDVVITYTAGEKLASTESYRNAFPSILNFSFEH